MKRTNRSSSRVSVAPIEPPPVKTMEEIRERVWRAFPTIQLALAKHIESTATEANAAPSVDTGFEVPLFTDAVVPEEEMRTFVECVFLAIHSNATAEDVQEALQTEFNGTGGNLTKKAEYTRAEVDAFLDRVMARWAREYNIPEAASESRDEAIKSLNEEIADCITDDNPPHQILAPDAVLMVSKPTVLTNPVVDFVKLEKPRIYAEVYDVLWGNVLDGRTSTTISLAQFRVFFAWFYSLHFSNSTAARAEAAAESLFRQCLNERAEMDMDAFQVACAAACRLYGRRRDIVVYLEELVAATLPVLQAAGFDTSGSVFFMVGDRITEGIAPRRVLKDPNELYAVDELRKRQHEVDVLQCRVSANRIILHGQRYTGKTTIGRALARALHCVHLDVLELALAALEAAAARRHAAGEEEEDHDDHGFVGDEDEDESSSTLGADPLAAQLERHLAKREPVPIALQAALIRRAVQSLRATHYGYVLSDVDSPLPAVSGQEEALAELLHDMGVTSAVVPTNFIEITCDPRLYAERSRVLSDAESRAHEQLLSSLAKQEAKRKRDAEKVQLRADCDKILKHAAELESAEGALPEGELEKAQAQAQEAHSILAALEAEEQAEVQAEAAAAQHRNDERLQGGNGEDEGNFDVDDAGAAASDPAAEAAERRKVLLEALIAQGRRQLRTTTAAQDEEALQHLRPLTSLSCLRRYVDAAAAEQRILSVDGTSPAEEAVRYITNALRLQPAHAAIEPASADKDTSNLPATLAGDEERGRIKEEAAAAEGYEVSYTWKNYCPVTAQEDGVLVEGAACYSCVFRGRLYYTASEVKMERFMASPHEYLRADPSDRQTLFLLTAKSVPNGEAIAQRLADSLGLTHMTVAEYGSGAGKLRAQRQSRAAALEARHVYEETERKVRAERAEKRAKLEAKLKKQKRRKSGGGGKKRSNVAAPASVIPVLGSPTGEARKRRKQKQAAQKKGVRMEDIVAQRIVAAKETRKSVLPILLTMDATSNTTVANADETERAVPDVEEDQRAKIDLLFEERLLPETVLVLEHFDTTPRSGGHGDAGNNVKDGRQEEEEEEADDKDAVLNFVIEKLESAAPAAKAWKNKAAEKAMTALEPQHFAIERVNTFGKTEFELVREIAQLLNSGVAQVMDGIVDEELGQGDDLEEEEEEEEDDNEEANGGIPPLRLEPMDPQLRPLKRFLHQFGSRLQYCPVTLYEKDLIVRGRNDVCCQYCGDLYVFASEECREKFQRNPLGYVDSVAPRSIPPRVWLTGVTHSGKKTLAAGIEQEFGVPHFAYDRTFFERCVEAAQTPTGAEVNGIFISPSSVETNPYLRRAHGILTELREFAKEEARLEKLREEAEKIFEERDRREERSDYDEDEEEGELDEEFEEQLRMHLEFEPEDEEEKQVRLSESYLRLASCVTRIEPFESKGYIMICSPFSEDDLDVLFAEGCVPEVVLNMSLTPEVYAQRAAAIAAEKQKAREVARRSSEARAARAQARQLKRKERALRKWRRRHIGVDDPPSDPEEEDGEEGEDENGLAGEAGAGEVGSVGDINVENEAIEEFLEGVEERLVEVTKIKGDRAKGAVLRITLNLLARHFKNRISFFYSAQVVAYDDALRMVERGVADLSSLYREDPVTLYNTRNGARRDCKWMPPGIGLRPEQSAVQAAVAERQRTRHADDDEDSENASEMREAQQQQQDAEEEPEMSELLTDDLEEMQERLDRRNRRLWSRNAPRAALLGPYVYFFETFDNLAKFLANPILYAEQPPSTPPMRVHPVVSIHEDDAVLRAKAHDDGGVKTRCLAESVAHNLGSVFISPMKLLSWAALHPRLGSLAASAVLAAMQQTADDALLEWLLSIRLASADVKERGAVLLNLPRTEAQYEALLASKSAAPIVKAASVMLDQASPAAKRAGAVLQRIAKYNVGELPVPCPSCPLDQANLNEFVYCVDELIDHERERVLRQQSAFPVDVRNTCQTHEGIEAAVSEYQWYCPYRWVEDGDLVILRGADPLIGAMYLGKYYLFSNQAYLSRFLENPHVVADPTTLKPLPQQLPSRLVIGDNVSAEELELELQGCCPVLLYDTRENKGLRGVTEPVAVKGSLDHIVRYDGKLYALLDEEHAERFLRRPWQYVGGAFMPPTRKCPLPPPKTLQNIEDEDFIRRQLYDPIARAMIAVSTVRPKYPGLSLEESALKYVALHIKAHNDAENNEIQKQQYKDSYKLFDTRATLYRSLAVEVPEERGKDEEASLDKYDRLCAEYEKIHHGFLQVNEFSHLKNVGGGGGGNSSNRGSTVVL